MSGGSGTYGPNYDSDEDPDAPQYSWRMPISQLLFWGVLPGVAAAFVSLVVSQLLFGVSVSVSEGFVAPSAFFIVGTLSFIYIAYVRDDEWNEFDPDYNNE